MVSGGRDRRVQLGEGEQILVKLYSNLVTSFSTLFLKLEALRAGPTATTAEGRAAWVRTHRQMLKAVKELLPTGTVDRQRLGEVLFRTVFTLADRHGTLDPFAVVTRDGDERVFVYG